MPCSLSGIDHTTFQLEALAVILYPTSESNCLSVPALVDGSVPLLILDHKSRDQLLFVLDSLSYGTVAMARLSKTTRGSNDTPKTTLEDKSAGVTNQLNFYQAHASLRELGSAASIFKDEAADTMRTIPMNVGPSSSPTNNVDKEMLTNAMGAVHDEASVTKDEGDVDSTILSKDVIEDAAAGLSDHPKARTRSKQLAKHVHSSLPLETLGDVPSITLIKDNRHASTMSVFWRKSYIYYSGSSGNTSFSGKLAMVLMSTICCVGVCMFGALLFAVALKVRLFHARRMGRSNHSHHGRTQQQANQQVHENGFKKVVPKVVLESYGVQTVLEISPTSVTLTPLVEKLKPPTVLFRKGKSSPWTEGVPEMEEGFEVRGNVRRQGTMTRRTGHRQLLDNSLEERIEDGSTRGGLVGHSHQTGSSLTPPMDGALEGTTVATMSGNSYGSIRVTYNRQGHPNPLPTPSTTVSLAPSYRHSSGSSPSRERSKCSSHPFANADAQTTCAICLTDYDVGEQVRTLPCHHQYHLGCIDPWLLSVAALCPICKRDLWPGTSSL
ncbi:MAG: hypothetical protein J3Q66DRAFT_339071 [Benniella sp.]|nr:MAG: hypothetical protein J3Q66DRAFT_339071 [Benniella sp.]